MWLPPCTKPSTKFGIISYGAACCTGHRGSPLLSVGRGQAGGHVCKGYSRPGKRHNLKALRVGNTAGHL